MSYARRDDGHHFQVRQPPYGPHGLPHVQDEQWVRAVQRDPSTVS
jgi:hypothetical protein